MNYCVLVCECVVLILKVLIYFIDYIYNFDFIIKIFFCNDFYSKFRIVRYLKLEILMFDDNRLSDVAVFVVLVGLKRYEKFNFLIDGNWKVL